MGRLKQENLVLSPFCRLTVQQQVVGRGCALCKSSMEESSLSSSNSVVLLVLCYTTSVFASVFR